jgi:hypothetical protein
VSGSNGLLEVAPPPVISHLTPEQYLEACESYRKADDGHRRLRVAFKTLRLETEEARLDVYRVCEHLRVPCWRENLRARPELRRALIRAIRTYQSAYDETEYYARRRLDVKGYLRPVYDDLADLETCFRYLSIDPNYYGPKSPGPTSQPSLNRR